MRQIKIEPVLNGFIVTIGCQKLAYTSIEKLLLNLDQYLRNPDETEKRFIEQEGINRKYTLSPTFCVVPAPDVESEYINSGMLSGGARSLQ